MASEKGRFEVSAASYREKTEDRALVIELEAGTVVCVADGAGGVSGGAIAAELFLAGVQSVTRADFDLTSVEAWTALVERLDRDIERHPQAGETTGIALAVTATTIAGASAGDSQAWLATPGVWRDLTEHQARKARLGTGRARAAAFTATPTGTLLVATDGLFGYVSPDQILAVLASHPDDGGEALVRLLRARYRRLPDDVAIVVGRLG